MNKEIFPRIYCPVLFMAVAMLLGSTAGLAQTVPPTAPSNLTGTAANCGEVSLAWSSATDNSGTGLNSYLVQRSDGVNVTVSALRTWLHDTNWVKAGATITYSVVALDNAGNQSAPSNSVVVTEFPSCAISAGEQIISPASVGTLDAKEPLGKVIATWGSRSAYLNVVWNSSSTFDTWIYVNDSDTGLSSSFVLHLYPGYYVAETDYVFTSATDLWTLSRSSGGQAQVSHYQLNGSTIPKSATLVSTQSFGDSHSTPRAMIRLQSGALMIAWNEADSGYFSTDLVAGFAYLSPTGQWTTQFPVTVTNPYGGNSTLAQMALVQHPADGSIWSFVHRDAFHEIFALHFTEANGTISLDWTNASYISQSTDGINGPETEFPFLNAIADPTRNAILLAYQRNDFDFVFSDPSVNNDSYKESTVAVAQIGADGSKNFIVFPNYIERQQQFGFSVQSDGTLWLAYHPINHQTLTWNKVYASNYSGTSWSAPVLAGFNYQFYNSIGPYRTPGLVAYRTDQPVVAFRTPDQKIHTFDLTNLNPTPADTTAPTTSITSPANGATLSGSVPISASASDNVGVTKVELWLDGTLGATDTTAPYGFSWSTTASANGTHTLQTRAYDAAGNVGVSSIVTVTVNNLTVASLAVSITNPTNGGTVPRNQTVTINAAAVDSTTITQVQFYVDNNLLGTTTTAPYSYPWKVSGKKGTHSIKAQAYDAKGNSAAQAITVTAQ